MDASESTVPQSGCGPPRVLVVDDDMQLGELLSRYLGGRGLQVSLADNGSRFREAMRALAFDRATLAYLRDHPEATVVALAEGLQTSSIESRPAMSEPDAVG